MKATASSPIKRPYQATLILNLIFFLSSSSFLPSILPKIASKDAGILQIDFVPTLCLLLGVPIPFSNVGKVVTPLFSYPLDCKRVRENAEFDCLEHIGPIKALWTSIAALRINIAQVQRYIYSYHKKSNLLDGWTQRFLDELLEHYDRQWVMLHNLPSSDANSNIRSLIKLRDNYSDYLTKIKHELDQVWASYDMLSLAGGLVLLCLSLSANYFATCFGGERDDITRIYKRIAIGLMMGSTIAALLRFLGLPLYEANKMYDAVFLSVLTSVLIAAYYGLRGLCSGIFEARHPVTKGENSNTWLAVASKPGSVTLMLAGIQFAAFFSNSAIVNEDALAYFLLVSLVLLVVAGKWKEEVSKNRRTGVIKLRASVCTLVALLVLLRIAKELRRCREEQHPACEESIFLKSILSFVGEEWRAFRSRRIVFSGLMLFLPIGIVLLWHRRLERNDQKESAFSEHSIAALCLKYLMPFAALCVAAHWVLAILDPKVLKKHLKSNQEALSRAASVLSGVLLVLLVIFPLTAEKTKRSFFGRTVNLFSALSLLNLGLFLPLSLWLGDGASIGLACVWMLGALLLHLFRTLEMEDLWTKSYLWFLLAGFGFFVTGHQTAIASIPWNAAFLATDQGGNVFGFGLLQAGLQVTKQVK